MRQPTNKTLRRLLLMEMSIDQFHFWLLVILFIGSLAGHYYLSYVGYFK